MTVARYDHGRIDGPKITGQGYLKADATPTRTGVFYYMNMDGTIRRELRHPEDVFAKDSMETLANVVVTNDHPPEPLNADNTGRFSCGWTGEKVDQAQEFLKTSITITSSSCIKQILDGDKQELSCGYFCDLEDAPGIYNGEEYDVRQKNIRYNHLAVVQRGRAGPEAKIQMDSLEQSFRADAAMMVEPKQKSTIQENENPVNLEKNKKKGSYMVKFKLDGFEYEVEDGALATAVCAHADAKEKALTELEDSKKEIETLNAKFDALNSEIAKSDEKIKELESAKLSEKEILKRADSLLKIVDLGKKVLGKDFNEDMEIAEIKKSVVSKEMPEVKVDEKGEIYVDAAFDIILSRSAKSGTDVLKTAVEKRVDAQVVVDSETARKKSMEESKNLWMK